jgi:hypothetical protein
MGVTPRRATKVKAVGRLAAKPSALGALPAFRTSAEFMALSDADRAKVAAYYERGVPPADLRPLTAAQRRQWQRMKRRGRPRKGLGAKPVSVTIEADLLRRADAYAQQHGLTRAALIARGLEAVIRRAG